LTEYGHRTAREPQRPTRDKVRALTCEIAVHTSNGRVFREQLAVSNWLADPEWLGPCAASVLRERMGRTGDCDQ
jgi:hypothetical protein